MDIDWEKVRYIIGWIILVAFGVSAVSVVLLIGGWQALLLFLIVVGASTLLAAALVWVMEY